MQSRPFNQEYAKVISILCGRSCQGNGSYNRVFFKPARVERFCHHP